MNNLIVKNVDLMGDTIMAAKDENGVIWAGVSYICNALGMNKGHKDRQVTNVQKDETLKRGCCKFEAGVFDIGNETVALKIDFIPLWLAKISITERMKEEHPELAEKLLNYQLKAKDILAEAFIPKQNISAKSPMEVLRLYYEALDQMNTKVDTLEEKVTNIENGMPCFSCDTKDIQAEVRAKAVECLGGYHSNAYNDKSTRGCVFSDIQMMLRREFGVRRYEEIKHNRVPEAINLIREYRLPLILKERIDMVNAQQSLF